MRPTRVGFVALIVTVVGVLLVSVRCADDPVVTPPEPRVPGAVLEFEDGTSILRRDLERFDEYLARVDPRLGRKTRIQGVLTQHVLQVALARRDHGEARELRHQEAAALAASVGNCRELMETCQNRGIGTEHGPAPRIRFPLAVAEFVFDPANIGAVSGPIETPHGFVVVGVRDIVQQQTTTSDLATAFLVGFPMFSTPEDYSAWWREARESIVGTISYQHPDLEEALPPWLSP